MSKSYANFIKFMGLGPQSTYFKKKVYCEDDDLTLRKFKGPAIIVSNHKSIYDYPLIMYTFYNKYIRCLIGETMFTHNKSLNRMLYKMGGIKVDRINYNFNFITDMSKALQQGHTGLIFPEGRLHLPDEDPDKLLPFAPSYVYIALQNNVPIIPVYTNGIYGNLKKIKKDRARIMIGKPIYPSALYDPNKSERDNISYINNYVRNYIQSLEAKLKLKVESEKYSINKFRRIFDHKWFLYDFVKWTSFISSSLYFRVKRVYVDGKKPKNIFKGKYIVCSNHISYEDVPAIINGIAGRRISFLTAKEVMERKRLGRLLKRAGCIKVDRDNFDIDSIKEAINVIDRGHVLCIFPEGKINRDGDIKPFKSGIVMTAYLSKADILPIYTARVAGRASRQMMIIGKKIKISNYVSGLYPSIDEINNITLMLNNKVLELKKIYDSKYSKQIEYKKKLEARKAKKLARKAKRGK